MDGALGRCSALGSESFDELVAGGLLGDELGELGAGEVGVGEGRRKSLPSASSRLRIRPS
jgi:hypothetical protein